MKYSKLIRMRIENLGCIGPDGLTIELDNIVCLVGQNNAGKSTILRAYELAATGKTLDESDICKWSNDRPAVVELLVHIPDGMANISEKWKRSEIREGKNGIETLRLVHSRWTWMGGNTPPKRETFNHELGDFDPEQNAGGFDAVFRSRLPRPLRIGSLQDAENEHSAIIKLIMDPLIKKIKEIQNDPDSDLFRALDTIVKHANKPVSDFQERIDYIQNDIGKAYANVFPERKVMLDVGFSKVNLDPAKHMTDMSTLKIVDGDIVSDLKQEGSGSRRALFWSMMQVRNRLTQPNSKPDKAAKPKSAKATSKTADIQDNADQIITSDVVFPGFMLLLDEPENALHPLAIRAARDYLYELANDDDWQVMLTTHSPYFIDPLADHTTIVRLERKGKTTTPRIYRADSIKFSDEESKNLKAILQMDVSLAEMFFGSYPIIVEGDTEYAAYLAAVVECKTNLCGNISVIRARGKATIPPLIRILSHFKVNFGVLHDADSPRTRSKGTNPAWGVNRSIVSEIQKARSEVKVRHRISIPDFEGRLGIGEIEKDKPIVTYKKVTEFDQVRDLVHDLFSQLFEGREMPFYEKQVDSDEIMDELEQEVKLWAQTHANKDVRFMFGEDSIIQSNSHSALKTE